MALERHRRRTAVLESRVASRKIVVCVATADRLDQLRRLLKSLAGLEASMRTEVEVLVVDNGRSQEAHLQRESLSAGTMPVSLVPETRTGIPFARNTLVRHALKMDPDFIAFLDDDEVVQPDWLSRLLDAADRFNCEVVAGPVVPRFGAAAPTWATESGVYERERFPTGHELPWAATGNTLVAAEVFRGMDQWFEPRFAATGGSDFSFFRRVREAGYRIVWCDGAVAFEHVPSHRVQPTWFIRRCLRTGSVRGAEIRRLVAAPVAFIHVVRAAAVTVAALMLAVLDSPRGWKALRRVRQALFHIGVVMGISGHVVEEYRTLEPVNSDGDS